jgi:hypothetical protein
MQRRTPQSLQSQSRSASCPACRGLACFQATREAPSGACFTTQRQTGPPAREEFRAPSDLEYESRFPRTPQLQDPARAEVRRFRNTGEPPSGFRFAGGGNIRPGDHVLSSSGQPGSTVACPTFVFRIKLVGQCATTAASGIRLRRVADRVDALREFRTCCRELRRSRLGCVRLAELIVEVAVSRRRCGAA